MRALFVSKLWKLINWPFGFAIEIQLQWRMKLKNCKNINYNKTYTQKLVEGL